MTKLIIIRHGNTFRPEDTPTRVGARTDLPLTEQGEEQALRLGHHFKSLQIKPAKVFTSYLRRTIDTARLVCLPLNCDATHQPLDFLNEIDYGPDENRTEDEVISRIGADAIKEWDKNGKMPEDWSPRPEEITDQWQGFLKKCVHDYKDETIFAVTSNGIARFVLPLITKPDNTPLKLSTGAYGTLEFSEGGWRLTDWNIRP